MNEENLYPVQVEVCLRASCPHSSLDQIHSTMHCFISIFQLNKVYAAL